jgi:hypothetical protein
MIFFNILQMFKYLGVFCMCFLLSGVRGDFLDDLKHLGNQALHTALDTLTTDGVKTLVSTAVSTAGTGEDRRSTYSQIRYH